MHLSIVDTEHYLEFLSRTPDFNPENLTLALDRILRREFGLSQPSHCLLVFPSIRAIQETPPSDRPSWSSDAFLSELNRSISALSDCYCVVEPVENELTVDLVFSAAKKAVENGIDVSVVSNKKIYWGLLSVVKIVGSNLSSFGHIKKSDMLKKTSITPDKWLDALALIGNKELGAPGVHNIGLKKAASLIEEYGSLSGVIDYARLIEGVDGKRIVEARESLVSTRFPMSDVTLGASMAGMRLDLSKGIQSQYDNDNKEGYELRK